jgi:hypothetical protein
MDIPAPNTNIADQNELTPWTKPADAGHLCFCLGIGLGHYSITSPCEA